MSYPLKTIAKIRDVSGRGTVMGADGTAHPVVYSLHIHQEMWKTTPGEPATPGLKIVDGTLRTLDSSTCLNIGTDYHLRLQDGKELEIWFSDIRGNQYIIQVKESGGLCDE